MFDENNRIQWSWDHLCNFTGPCQWRHRAPLGHVFCTMESHWSMHCWLNRVPLPFFYPLTCSTCYWQPSSTDSIKAVESVMSDIPSLIPPRPAFRCTWCFLVPLVTFPEETQTHSTLWPLLFFQPVFASCNHELIRKIKGNITLFQLDVPPMLRRESSAGHCGKVITIRFHDELVKTCLVTSLEQCVCCQPGETRIKHKISHQKADEAQVYVHFHVSCLVWIRLGSILYSVNLGQQIFIPSSVQITNKWSQHIRLVVDSSYVHTWWVFFPFIWAPWIISYFHLNPALQLKEFVN